MSIKQQHDWIVGQLESYAKQLAELRNVCTHEHATYEFVGNMMDGYDKKYTCPECGDRWVDEECGVGK